MVIAQPVLERQSMEQAAMDFIPMQKVIVTVPSPVDCDQLAVAAEGIPEATCEHRQRLHIEVVAHFAEHDQVEGACFSLPVELGPQVAALDPHVVQTGAAASCPFNGSL